MIRCGFMNDRVFTHQDFESPVAEMSLIITDDSARGTEMRENIFFQIFENHPVVIRPSRYGICLF